MALIGYGVFFLTKSISFLWNCFCKKWNDDISKIKASKAIKKKIIRSKKMGWKKRCETHGSPYSTTEKLKFYQSTNTSDSKLQILNKFCPQDPKIKWNFQVALKVTFRERDNYTHFKNGGLRDIEHVCGHK